jgi:hypothetical protein
VTMSFRSVRRIVFEVPRADSDGRSSLVAAQSKWHCQVPGRSSSENQKAGQSPVMAAPSSIETISPSCFAGCRNLSKVTLAHDCRVSMLGDWAFSSCPALGTLSLRRMVREVRRLTMASSGIRSVTIDPVNESFSVYDEFLVNLGRPA